MGNSFPMSYLTAFLVLLPSQALGAAGQPGVPWSPAEIARTKERIWNILLAPNFFIDKNLAPPYDGRRRCAGRRQGVEDVTWRRRNVSSGCLRYLSAPAERIALLEPSHTLPQRRKFILPPLATDQSR